MDVKLALTFSQVTTLLTIAAAMLFSSHFARNIVRNAFAPVHVDPELTEDMVLLTTRFSFTFSGILSVFSAIGNLVARLLGMLAQGASLSWVGIALYGVTASAFLLAALYLVFVFPSLPENTFQRRRILGWMVLLVANGWLVVLVWLT